MYNVQRTSRQFDDLQNNLVEIEENRPRVQSQSNITRLEPNTNNINDNGNMISRAIENTNPVIKKQFWLKTYEWAPNSMKG
jgi:hypothetical protein